jgi:hypothetical protein
MQRKKRFCNSHRRKNVIYDFPNEDDPIKQGDIFIGIPKVEIEFAKGLPTASTQSEIQKVPWEEIVKSGNFSTALLPVFPVPAIVASQDCDVRWRDYITLCEIREFASVEPAATTNKLSKIVSAITKHSRLNMQWFYLPQDKRIGFDKRMGVDFFSTIRVPRRDLEELIKMRKGRLKEVARDHFRERLAYFYRRYAYNEWYPLNKEEIAVYPNRERLEPKDLYDWQK